MASATPPPCARCLLAALTMASTLSAVMSPCASSSVALPMRRSMITGRLAGVEWTCNRDARLVNVRAMRFGLRLAMGTALLALVSSGNAQLPDLIVWGPSMMPTVQLQLFDPSDCAVVDGLVLPGWRRLLTFTSDTRNVGDADLVLGDPSMNPLFEPAPC